MVMYTFLAEWVGKKKNPPSLCCARSSLTLPSLVVSASAHARVSARCRRPMPHWIEARFRRVPGVPGGRWHPTLLSDCRLSSRSQVAQSCPTLCNPMGSNSPWNSPGQHTGVGSLSLLLGIFPTQGSNAGLPALQADSLAAELPGKAAEWLTWKLKSYPGPRSC